MGDEPDVIMRGHLRVSLGDGRQSRAAGGQSVLMSAESRLKAGERALVEDGCQQWMVAHIHVRPEEGVEEPARPGKVASKAKELFRGEQVARG